MGKLSRIPLLEEWLAINDVLKILADRLPCLEDELGLKDVYLREKFTNEIHSKYRKLRNSKTE